MVSTSDEPVTDNFPFVLLNLGEAEAEKHGCTAMNGSTWNAKKKKCEATYEYIWTEQPDSLARSSVR